MQTHLIYLLLGAALLCACAPPEPTSGRPRIIDGDSLELAAELTLAGLALAYRQYSSDYIDEEAEAMAARRGLWSGEFQAPWDYRRNPEPAAAQPVRREVSDPCASGGSTKTRPASRKLAVGTCSGYSSV